MTPLSSGLRIRQPSGEAVPALWSLDPEVGREVVEDMGPSLTQHLALATK